MNKELNTLISSLSEDSFKILVQDYNKEKYKTPHVRIIDGPYDGGNDLEILVGEKEIRKNIQITVQKTGYESKLEADLEKAAENISKYDYLKIMEFYISLNISKEKRNELELNAELNHGIKLTIIDGLILSQEASNFNSIRENAFKFHKINSGSEKLVVDQQTKVLYDVLTLDKNSVEIKRNFINSYIFSFLYSNPNSTSEQIFNFINPHLNNTLDSNFLEKELNYLRSKQYLDSPKENKKVFNLSNNKHEEISAIFANVLSQEDSLQSMIKEFILNHNLTCSSEELIGLLYKLYQENYTIDIEEIKATNNSFSASIKKSYYDLIAYFTKKEIAANKAKELARELLQNCDKSDYLNKLSSIQLFNNLYSSNKLEKYVNNKVQEILLDTQILIRIICVLYKETHDFSDPALQSVKILLNTFDKYKDRMKLISTHDYVSEATGHLIEAIKLQRFLDLSVLSKLGPSKNVFYNTYIEFRKYDIIDDEMSFLEFIEDLIDEDIDDSNLDKLTGQISKKIATIFEMLGLKLISHPMYNNYQTIKKEYEISLAYASKDRSHTARENDLRTILYLATRENHTNKETDEVNEPFLVTWDSAFYIFRKKLIESHKELTYWYIYSPLKVVDRFSVMNFNLNPKSINLNIIALTESNFNYSTKTTSFLDVISSFFNDKDVSKMNIITKLADLKESTQATSEIPSDDVFKDKEADKLTYLLNNLKGHYVSYETEFKFDDIIHVFEMPKFENQIVTIFKNTISDFKVDLDLTIMYKSFDQLIITSKEDNNAGKK